MKRLATYIFSAYLIIAAASCTDRSESIYESDLKRIEQALERSDEYLRIKQQKISTIENMLNSRGVTSLQQYNIYDQLFLEYQPFQFDKAKEMLDRQLDIALEIGNDSLRLGAMLDKAMRLLNRILVSFRIATASPLLWRIFRVL